MIHATLRHLRALVMIGAAVALAGVGGQAQSTTVRITQGLGGTEPDGPSSFPRISADGRVIAFLSFASNLVPGDTNGQQDVFVHIRTTGAIERVSIGSQGEQAVSGCSWPTISGDGRYVAFVSSDSSLPAGGGTGSSGNTRIYLRDRALGTLRTFDGGPQYGGALSPLLSTDGRYLAWSEPYCPSGCSSPTTAPLHRLRVDLIDGSRLAYTMDFGSSGTQGAISGSGRFHAVSSGSYVGVLDYATMTNVSLGVPGTAAGSFYPFSLDFNSHMALSTWVAYSPLDMGGIDIYVFELSSGSVERATVPASGGSVNGESTNPSLSLDGRFVAFESLASNLGPSDAFPEQDIYVRDLLLDSTELVSMSTVGVQGNGMSSVPSTSGDGRFVAFQSRATNLAPSDTNTYEDIFVRDRGFPSPSNFCVAKINSQGCLPSIGYQGTPSLGGPDDFVITASLVRNQSAGILFWGSQPDVVPFGGGIRCVHSPVIRTTPQLSGGSTSPVRDCSGTYAFPFSHAYMQGYLLPVGTVLYAQYWQRDPPHPDGTGQGLTDGLRFTITP